MFIEFLRDCEEHKKFFCTTVSSLEAAGKKSVKRKLRKQGVRMGDFENRSNYVRWVNRQYRWRSVTPAIERLQVRWQCNFYFTRAHWRAVGGLVLLNMQRNGAKMDQKQRQKQNEDMRVLTHYILIIIYFCQWHWQLLLSTALQLSVLQSFGLLNHLLPPSSILDKGLPIWHFWPLYIFFNIILTA